MTGHIKTVRAHLEDIKFHCDGQIDIDNNGNPNLAMLCVEGATHAINALEAGEVDEPLAAVAPDLLIVAQMLLKHYPSPAPVSDQVNAILCKAAHTIHKLETLRKNQTAVTVPATGPCFLPEDFQHVAYLMRETVNNDNQKVFQAICSNNWNIILTALDKAGQK
jgi:hypothetical protein